MSTKPFFTTAALDASTNGALVAGAYLEDVAAFLAEEDPPTRWIFPDLLPADVLMLIHGEPRARKSLVGFELALSAATGTAPFGLAAFQPGAPIPVLYVQEEDTRSLTRPRLRRLVHERCGGRMPDTLKVVVRRGVDLDDPAWVTRLTDDVTRLGIRFLVLDAMRRLSIKTDEGPAKVRELIAVLRAIVTTTGVTIAVVHHDIKPRSTARTCGDAASGPPAVTGSPPANAPSTSSRSMKPRAWSIPRITSFRPTRARSPFGVPSTAS